MIDGYTRTCGLIGNPVEHTMSPAIHNTLAQCLGDNLAYLPFHVEAGLVGDAVRGAYALNLLGCNVTVPYKSDVIPYLVELDPLARQIGAVNTLVRAEGGFKGYNTDMPGLYRALRRDGVQVEDKTAVILGAGGVARAVAVLLAQKGAEKVLILNRTVERAQAIASEVCAAYGASFAEAWPLDEWRQALDGASRERSEGFLVIQATKVGMYPNVGEAPIEEKEFYQKVGIGYDLVFNPARTRFMELVEEAGGRSYGGLGMLLYQGVIAYELWTGRQVDDALADVAYGKMKEAMGID